MPISAETLATYRHQYDENGYVIVDDIIPEHLMDRLVDASDRVTEKTRSGKWKHARVVGKQFPPFDAGDDIWGVQHILHPDLCEPVFAEFYGSEDLLDVSAALMGASREEMQLELFNLLVNPLKKDYALSWHRDFIKPDVIAEEEARQLEIAHYGVQWNIALYDDCCLTAVPGSHRRVRTAEERTADLWGGPKAMPGAETIHLKRGQMVAYQNNLLHVGKYDLTQKRRTLHGCYGAPPSDDIMRARGVLQHGLEYTSRADFRASLPPVLLPMLDKTLEMRKRLEGQDLGYALSG